MGKETASEFFFSLQDIYVHRDYRCLVPYSHKNPEKWKTYEMHDYRAAFSEEKLNDVQQFKYDKNFNNWVDPKVLKSFTKSTKSMRKTYKKSYGFPYVSLRDWDGKHMTNKTIVNCANSALSQLVNMSVEKLVKINGKIDGKIDKKNGRNIGEKRLKNGEEISGKLVKNW